MGIDSRAGPTITSLLVFKIRIVFINIHIAHFSHIANTLKANNSQNHAGYSLLNYGIVSYINDKNSQYFISIILRARGELLNLNGKSFNSTADTLCSLCNLKEKENTYHFVGKCPIFKFDRIIYFGKNVLSELEFVDIMNGKNYYNLFKFLTSCLKYRDFILNDCY